MTKMKKFTLLLSIVLVGLSARADYAPLDISQMILQADKIIYGEIVSVGNQKLLIKIEGSVTGDEGELIINKFQNWTCAHRWVDYAKGQRSLFLLRKYENEYYIMSGGGEGELPLVNESLMVRYYCLDYNTVGKENEGNPFNYDFKNPPLVYGKPFHGIEVPLNDFLETARLVRSCTASDNSGWYRVKFTCPEAQLETKAAEIPFLSSVYHKLLEHKVK